VNKKCNRYEFIEWGILFREEKQGMARFASFDWLNQLRDLNPERLIRLAGHLCSSRCEQVLNGDPTFVQYLMKEVNQ